MTIQKNDFRIPVSRTLDRLLIARRETYAFIRYNTPRKTWNLLRQRIEQALGATRVGAAPYQLIIEATSACNLRCPFCHTGKGEKGRKAEFLTPERLEAVLEELGPRAYTIDFQNWGEPLLNPRIYELVAAARRHGIVTSIHTNFNVPFDDAKAERMIEAGLIYLSVSADGADQSAYAKYRVRGRFDLLLNNLKTLLAARRRLGALNPFITWQFLVFRHNEHQIAEAEAIAKDLGVDRFHSLAGFVEEESWLPEGNYQTIPGLIEKRCSFLWRQAVINPDGGIAPCCNTFESSHDFADFKEGGFQASWNNPKFQAARWLFRKKGRGRVSADIFCTDCPKAHPEELARAAAQPGGLNMRTPFTLAQCAPPSSSTDLSATRLTVLGENDNPK